MEVLSPRPGEMIIETPRQAMKEVDARDHLAERFDGQVRRGQLRIGIVGLGYADLPMAIGFSARFPVFGYDISQEKVSTINQGETPIYLVLNFTWSFHRGDPVSRPGHRWQV